MDREDTAMMCLFFLNCITIMRRYVQRRNVRRPRAYAVRPLNRQRHQLGHYTTLVRFIRNHDVPQFFKYTRMTPELYKHLLQLVRPHLQKTVNRRPLSPGHQLTMTLHYLSEGCSMQQIAWDYYIGKTTAHKIIKHTCQVLWNVLMPVYLPAMSNDDLESVERGYYMRWNVPNCIGALDGKHVAIQAPPHTSSDYFSYKKTFSIVVMATCDAFYRCVQRNVLHIKVYLTCYRFSYVNIGSPGSQHDSKTFRESGFGSALLGGRLPIPQDKSLPGCRGTFPHFLVADQAFPLHKHIMRPYPGDNLPLKKKVFNYRISRARRCIENTFGILVQRWRCLRKPIIGNIETCNEIVQAAIVLHNFVQKKEEDIPLGARRYCPTGYADFVDDNGEFQIGQWRNYANNLQSVGRTGSNNPSRSTQLLREELATYFMSPAGKVDWQYDIVEEGSMLSLKDVWVQKSHCLHVPPLWNFHFPHSGDSCESEITLLSRIFCAKHCKSFLALFSINFIPHN